MSVFQKTVHVSTKLNRSHLVTGRTGLILPCLGRTEADGGQFVTTENSMGVVQMSRGRLPPASAHLLSEPAIVARLACTDRLSAAVTEPDEPRSGTASERSPSSSSWSVAA